MRLELELDEAVRSGGQEGDAARILRSQTAIVEGRLSEEDAFRVEQRTTGTNRVREELMRERESINQDLSGVEAEIAEMDERIAGLADRLVAVETAGLELSRQAREIGRLAQKRERMAQALDESEITDALSSARISNVVVAAPPSASLLPASPKLSLLLAVAAVLGVGATGIVLILLELLRPRLRSPDDLRNLLEAHGTGPSIMVKSIPAVPGLRQ